MVVGWLCSAVCSLLLGEEEGFGRRDWAWNEGDEGTGIEGAVGDLSLGDDRPPPLNDEPHPVAAAVKELLIVPMLLLLLLLLLFPMFPLSKGAESTAAAAAAASSTLARCFNAVSVDNEVCVCRGGG